MAGKKGGSRYVCSSCGYVSARWMGQCPACGEWDTLVEEKPEKELRKRRTSESAQVKPITAFEAVHAERIKTGIGELDRTLGGGIVPGSVVLIGGEPGAGKSTLLMQVAGKIAGAGKKVLYASAEESAGQIKLRAERLSVNSENVLLFTGTVFEDLEAVAERENVHLIILDSIQTFRKETIPSSPGSPLQVREITASVVEFAKKSNIPVFVVGHVTKEGMIAGPRLLEHMVDTVIYFDAGGPEGLRLLRCVKNRFGPINEVGAFVMTSRGLEEVPDPATFFLSGSEKEAGVALAGVREGTRDFVIEVHSLIRPVPYGNGRRLITGFEAGRALQVLAVLEKFTGRDLRQYDVYISTVRGVKIRDTSADLGIFASLYGGIKNLKIPGDFIFVGEVTLTGKVLPDLALEERIATLRKMGWNKIFAPAQVEGCVRVTHVEELIEKLRW